MNGHEPLDAGDLGAGQMQSLGDTRAVGLVLGTPAEASTPLSFSVYIDPDRYLQLDDVVHVRSPLPG